MKALIDFYTNEWFFAFPMTLMMFIAFALVIWRFLLNQGVGSNLDLLLPDLQMNLRKKGVKAATALCEEERGLIPKILFVSGLQAAEQGVAAMRRSMTSAVELEIMPRLNFLLPTILAIAKISTMAGLLLTVISMIGTFSSIGEEAAKGSAGASGMSEQSKKIGLALFATALGLLTAIPLVFSHVLFKAWIAKFEIKMKVAAQKLVTLVQKIKSDPNGEDDEDEAVASDDPRRKPAKARR